METPLQQEDVIDNFVELWVTILILVETPLQRKKGWSYQWGIKVTILILVETPLQQKDKQKTSRILKSHNPYFSGNSFATRIRGWLMWFVIVTILILVETPLQPTIFAAIVAAGRVTILILVETPLQQYQKFPWIWLKIAKKPVIFNLNVHI